MNATTIATEMGFEGVLEMRSLRTLTPPSQGYDCDGNADVDADGADKL